jgi:hypothetical protein
MRLACHRRGVRLASVSRSEFVLLQLISPTADYSNAPALRRRLFPDPVSAAQDDQTAGAIREDWLDFVVPQIEKQFLEAHETVRQDLEMSQPSRRNVRPSPYARQTVDVFIPAQHAAAWYSALNQARMAIHCHREETGQSDVATPPFFSELQSEFYAMIQGCLLETQLSGNNSQSAREDAAGTDDPR